MGANVPERTMAGFWLNNWRGLLHTKADYYTLAETMKMAGIAPEGVAFGAWPRGEVPLLERGLSKG